MVGSIAESVVEEAILSLFEELGYTVINGANIAPGEPNAERTNYNDVVLKGRLPSALFKNQP